MLRSEADTVKCFLKSGKATGGRGRNRQGLLSYPPAVSLPLYLKKMQFQAIGGVERQKDVKSRLEKKEQCIQVFHHSSGNSELKCLDHSRKKALVL